MFYPSVARICSFFTNLLTRMSQAANVQARKQRIVADKLRTKAQEATDLETAHLKESSKAANASRNIKKLFDE